jgi:hypothetical protein
MIWKKSLIVFTYIRNYILTNISFKNMEHEVLLGAVGIQFWV